MTLNPNKLKPVDLLVLFLTSFVIFPVSFAFSQDKRSKPASTELLPGTTKGTDYRDLYPDTWVANDALGRTMPGFQEVGPVKTDQRRVVGIFI